MVHAHQVHPWNSPLTIDRDRRHRRMMICRRYRSQRLRAPARGQEDRTTRRINRGVHQLYSDGRAQDQFLWSRVSGHLHHRRRLFPPREEGGRYRSADLSVSRTRARTGRSRRRSAMKMRRMASRKDTVPDHHGNLVVPSSLPSCLHQASLQPPFLLWSRRIRTTRKITMNQVVHTVRAIRHRTVRKRFSTRRTMKICLCPISINVGAQAPRHIGLQRLHSRSLSHVMSITNLSISTV